MAMPLGFLSICPRVRKVQGQLVASTAWLLRILTLGGFYRKVIVDPERHEVTLYRRYLWLLARRRRLPFTAIKAITYGYQDWALGSSLTWAHDSVDLFAVGLRLQKDDDLHLFYFFGDGTFTNDGPLPDWLYWENYAFDLSGTQERESRVFVEVLSKMIGVTVLPARS